jgi:hypothetical protein
VSEKSSALVQMTKSVEVPHPIEYSYIHIFTLYKSKSVSAGHNYKYADKDYIHM